MDHFIRVRGREFFQVLPFPTKVFFFLINKYFSRKKEKKELNEYWVLWSATKKSLNKYLGGPQKNIRDFSQIFFLWKRWDKKSQHAFFQNEIAPDFQQAVYPIRSHPFLTIFVPFESSQSQLSKNLNFIKIRCDLMG